MTPHNTNRYIGIEHEEHTTHTLIRNGIRLARTSRAVRTAVRELVAELDRQAELEQHGDPTIPPPAFRDALRRPVGSKRKTITVLIYGKRVSLLLNPQGKENPHREQYLWDFVCARVAKELAA